jgi:hypothetical protein
MGLFDIFSGDDGRRAAQDAYDAQAGGLKRGHREARRDLQRGERKAIGALNQGNRANQRLYNRGEKGVDYYGQLLGLGGNSGKVQETLEGIPGYQFARDQGLDSINRLANSRGMLSSGNNSQDLLRFSQGLADQNYFNYLGAVQPYFGLGQNAASGMQQNASQQANIYQNTGNNLANYGYNTNVGLGQAGAELYQNQFQADQGANQNLWNAILGVGGAVTGAAGQAGGFGTLFS